MVAAFVAGALVAEGLEVFVSDVTAGAVVAVSACELAGGVNVTGAVVTEGGLLVEGTGGAGGGVGTGAGPGFGAIV